MTVIFQLTKEEGERVRGENKLFWGELAREELGEESKKKISYREKDCLK